jgi:predicted transcriptional regulator
VTGHSFRLKNEHTFRIKEVPMHSLVSDICQPQTWLESRVYLLLRHHGIQRPEQIRLTDLCASYGIELRSIRGRSRAHRHPAEAGRFVIAVDERLDEPARRVKIAHELGHLLLHEGVQPLGSDLMIDWQEAQANHFAEHLLMPYYMFTALIGHCTRFEAPFYLARTFRVPLDFAHKRFDRFLNRLYAKGYPVAW